MVIDRPDDLFGVPGHPDLAAGIAGLEEPGELGPAPVIQAFVGLGESPPGPIQQVVFVAPVAAGLVLDPAADLIEAGVGQLHQVERVRDLGGRASDLRGD